MKRIYQERIFSGVVAIVPGSFGLSFLVVFLFAKFLRDLDDEPALWLFLGVSLFLLIIAINFSFLRIKVFQDGITAGFGVIRHHVAADNIAAVYQDKAPNTAYKGFGFRWGSVNGRRRLVYEVSEAPRVVIRQKQDSDREFVFSTRKPDSAIKAVRSLTKQKSNAAAQGDS